MMSAAQSCKVIASRCFTAAHDAASYALALSRFVPGASEQQRVVRDVQEGWVLMAAIQGLVRYEILPRCAERKSTTARVAEQLDRGEMLVAAAIGEGRNSHPRRLQTMVERRVDRDDGNGIVNGTKNFSSGVEWASYILVLAREHIASRDAKSNEARVPLTLELVECSRGGVEVGAQKDVAGLEGVRHGPVTFSGAISCARVVSSDEGYWVATREFRRLEDLMLGVVYCGALGLTALRDECVDALRAERSSQVKAWLAAMERVEALPDVPSGLATLLKVGKRVRVREQELLPASSL